VTEQAGTALVELTGGELTLPTEADTEALGARIGAELAAGDVVLLSGPLGAGKTVLARGIGRGLGVAGAVTSPTFVIARVHADGRIPLVHVDAYRLSSVAEVDDLDLDASLADSLTVVEWGEGLVEGLADGHLRVEIDRPDEGETRTVRFVVVAGEQQPPDWTGRLNAS
jgi:tRNA threonylcarbamoyladenosine biosynthesis protein TsaE